MSKKKIAFAVNQTKAGAVEAESFLRTAAGEIGVEVVEAGSADVIVALGGDGTILHAAHGFPGRTLLGLNLGGLGFLASVERKDFRRALEMLAEGRYKVSRRTMLKLSKGGVESAALNDVVLRSAAGHASVVDLSVDGAPATRYHADGLVVATPTGSTAYSLSAGGPVLMPDSRSFVVTPVCPHALGARALVVPDTCRMTLSNRPRLGGVEQRVAVCADGEELFGLAADEQVEICKAEECVAFAELEGYDPYEVLSRKLGWRGSSLAEGER